MEAMEHEKRAAGDLSRDQDKAEPGPEEARREDGSAAEALEGDNGDAAEPTAAESSDKALDVLQREAEPLQRGDAIDSPLGPLPKRSLVAMAVIVVVAVVVYLLAWALLGTLGLLLGLIPAAALGFLAAREWGRRTAV